MKIFKRGFITIFLFFSLWYIIGQIDWIRILHIQEIIETTEEKLGEVFLDFFKNTSEELTDPYLVNSIDTNTPQSFKEMDNKWNNYFLFEPNLYIGINF